MQSQEFGQRIGFFNEAVFGKLEQRGGVAWKKSGSVAEVLIFYGATHYPTSIYVIQFSFSYKSF